MWEGLRRAPKRLTIHVRGSWSGSLCVGIQSRIQSSQQAGSKSGRAAAVTAATPLKVCPLSPVPGSPPPLPTPFRVTNCCRCADNATRGRVWPGFRVQYIYIFIYTFVPVAEATAGQMVQRSAHLFNVFISIVFSTTDINMPDFDLTRWSRLIGDNYPHSL